MPHEVIRFQCDFCNKSYSSKGNATRHEKQCYANPKVKACRTCRYFFSDYQTVYNNHHGGNPGSTDYEVKYHWCEKYEKELGTKIPFQYNCKFYLTSGKDNFKEV